MDYLKQFVIPFVGLSNGYHQFDYRIDEEFFAAFGNSEIKEALVHVGLNLEKQERMLVLHFSVNGKVNVLCDRCLGAFDMPISTNEEYFVRFGHEHKEENENVLVIAENETHIDVASLIYDYICLQLPFRIVHPEDDEGNSQCDPEVLAKIAQLSAPKEQNSPWDALKNLKME